MKKLLLIVAVMCFGLTSLQAQKRFGAQVNYSTSTLAGLGFGAHGEFFFNDKISLQPAFDYYLAKDQPSVLGVTIAGTSSWAINADGHYYFTEGATTIYGIAGLSYVNFSTGGGTASFGGFSTALPSVSTSTIGVNIGAGANFGEGSTVPFVEAKYNSPYAGLVLTAGVRFGSSK